MAGGQATLCRKHTTKTLQSLNLAEVGSSQPQVETGVVRNGSAYTAYWSCRGQQAFLRRLEGRKAGNYAGQGRAGDLEAMLEGLSTVLLEKPAKTAERARRKVINIGSVLETS